MTNNKENIHLVAPHSHVSQEMRETRHSHKGMVFWLTGLSGAGKSTLAHTAELMLFENGYFNGTNSAHIHQTNNSTKTLSL